MGANPIFLSNLKNGAAVIQNADASALKTLVTPGASGSRVKSIYATSDDSSDRVVQLWVTKGGVDYLLGEFTLVDGAGSNGTDKSYNVLNNTDFPAVQFDGVNRLLDLESGSVLKVKAKTTVTAAKTLYFLAEYGDI